jgi:hypothetical protein
MKKVLLAAIAVAVIGMTSCKKEEGAQPDATNSAVKIENKKDTTQWD